jgi:inorganic triphosphatase YgiF
MVVSDKGLSMSRALVPAVRGHKTRAQSLPKAHEQPPPCELEFKLSLSEKHFAALEREVDGGGALMTIQLEAHYFDTPDDKLAAAGLALRLRRENGRWLQTLKMDQGEANLRRIEHEVDVGRAGHEPMPAIDLHRHDGTSAGRAAAEALGVTQPGQAPEEPLVRRYGTDILRRKGTMNHRGARVEVAFDCGHVEAGAHRIPVREVELELKSGSPDAVAALARKWVRRYGAWLSSETKAERGRRLAVGDSHPIVVKAQPPRLVPPLSTDAVTRAVMTSCLAHILPNAAALAAGSRENEHIHQLRVGVRRLRTALRELKAHSDAMPTHIEAPLARLFRALGEHRDQEAVLAAVKPKLLAAGASGVAWASQGSADIDIVAQVRHCEVQCALIDLADFALGEASGPPKDRVALQRKARKRLGRLHHNVQERGGHFEQLAEEDQHDLRKRLKRLRYLSEFVAPLFGEASVERYLQALRPAQDALGENNDLVVARTLAKRSARRDPDAKFASKWLKHAQRKTAAKASKVLAQVAAAEPFWGSQSRSHAH